MDIEDFGKDEIGILKKLKKGSVVRFDKDHGDPDIIMKKISDGIFDMNVKIGSGDLRKVAYAMLVCDEIIAMRVTRTLLNKNEQNNNGLFVAVSSDGTNRVMTSPDGITWREAN